jgi:UDP-N-acetylglucosamine 4,6-dehydratase
MGVMPSPSRRPCVLAGRAVLVTGGSGSFGNAFVRRALDEGAKRVVVYSRDELKQAQMRQRFPDDRMRWFLGCVRDLPRLRRAMEDVEIVIHAAALKRIEAGERDPGEFVKTNVLGTMNIVDAAHDAGVSRVVALSTDKASQSSTLYGSTKHVAEWLIVSANNARGAKGPLYATCRYGNISGSRGSVIPVWREKIANGEPLPITDPDCTRYWMPIDASVELVAWTATHMTGGEVVVPDLPAYRLADLATAMGGTVLPMKGLAAGEKLHESMIGPDELARFRRHGPYWSTKGTGDPLFAPLTSDTAPRFSVEEIRARLTEVQAVAA